MNKHILLINFLIFFFTGCHQKEKSTVLFDTINQEKINTPPISQQQESGSIDSIMNEILKDKKIIYTGKQLRDTQGKLPERNIKTVSNKNKIEQDFYYSAYPLFLLSYKDFEILVDKFTDGDYGTLHVIENDKFKIDEFVTLYSAYYDSTDEDNNYKLRDSEIYDDYLIKVIIDQAKDGVKERLFEYYYINDDGYFKEIKTIEDIKGWKEQDSF